MMSFLYIEGAEDGAAEGVVLHPLLHGEKIGGGVGKLCVDLVAERRGVESGYRGKAENRRLILRRYYLCCYMPCE